MSNINECEKRIKVLSVLFSSEKIKKRMLFRSLQCDREMRRSKNTKVNGSYKNICDFRELVESLNDTEKLSLILICKWVCIEPQKMH